VGLPEEVVPAEELALTTEALVREVPPAVVTPHALGVPRALQYVEQELVQDGLGAARTLDDHAGGSGGVQRGGVGPTCTHDHRDFRARHSVGTNLREGWKERGNGRNGVSSK